MFLTMFEKTWNIVLTMHIGDVLKSSGKVYNFFSNVKQRANFQNSNSVFGVCKSYSGLHFWLNNQAFVIALNKVPKTKNIM